MTKQKFFFFFLREGLQFTTQLFEMMHEFAEYQTRHTIPNWNQDAGPGVGVRVHYNHAAASCLEQMKLSTANMIGTWALLTTGCIATKQKIVSECKERKKKKEQAYRNFVDDCYSKKSLPTSRAELFCLVFF